MDTHEAHIIYELLVKLNTGEQHLSSFRFYYWTEIYDYWFKKNLYQTLKINYSAFHGTTVTIFCEFSLHNLSLTEPILFHL